MNTNAMIQANDHYAAEFERLADSLAGHNVPWLRELRRDAINSFVTQGFPRRVMKTGNIPVPLPSKSADSIAPLPMSLR